jgi:hypothetical protein
VLAAAVDGRAEFIVTENLSDFPKAATQAERIQAIHPDDFPMSLFQEDGDAMMGAFLNYAESSARVDTHDTVWTILARCRRNNVSVFARSVETRLQ